MQSGPTRPAQRSILESIKFFRAIEDSGYQGDDGRFIKSTRLTGHNPASVGLDPNIVSNLESSDQYFNALGTLLRRDGEAQFVIDVDQRKYSIEKLRELPGELREFQASIVEKLMRGAVFTSAIRSDMSREQEMLARIDGLLADVMIAADTSGQTFSGTQVSPDEQTLDACRACHETHLQIIGLHPL